MHVDYLSARGESAHTSCVPETVMYICRRGAISVSSEHTSFVLGESDACIVAPNVKHRLSHRENISFTRIDFDLNSLSWRRVSDSPSERDAAPENTLCASMSQDICELPNFTDASRIRLIDFIHEELSGSGTRHRMALQGMVDDLLLEISTALSEHGRQELSATQIMGYIDENFATTSLSETAAHFYCHPNTIANVLQKHNLSFLDMLTDAKMRHAAMLLRAPDMTMQGIAYACGYTSVSHFYEVFRKRYSMTPGQYREMLKSHSSTNVA